MEDPPPAMTPWSALGWTFLFATLTSLFQAAASSLHESGAIDEGSVSLLTAAASLLCVFGIARVHAPTKTISDLLGAQPVATTMGALAAFPLSAIERVIERRWPLTQAVQDEVTHALSTIGHGSRVSGAVISLVMLPVAHELFFRGALFTAAESPGNQRSAFVLSTLGYGLFYVAVWDVTGIHYLPLTLTIGALCGFARVTTGSVLGAIGVAVAYYAVDATLTLHAFGTIDPLVTHATLRAATPAPWIVYATIGALACAFVLRKSSDRATHGDRPAP
jgi:membrane protease YdiL (CAAX protease family)